jgi:hypothetical protein
MRLRLVVQRQSLPTTRILWSTETAHGSTGKPSSALTVASFLEDVNQIVPLESDHWGLEDYAVELDGFECLHFTPISDAFQELDEVV